MSDVKKATKEDALAVSQSTETVGFKVSKDHNGMKKGQTYPVSKNVAEILKLKGLGEQVELPKKKKGKK